MVTGRRDRELELPPTRGLPPASTAPATAALLLRRRSWRIAHRLRRDVEANALAAVVELERLAVGRPGRAIAAATSAESLCRAAERGANERRHPGVLFIARHRFQPILRVR